MNAEISTESHLLLWWVIFIFYFVVVFHVSLKPRRNKDSGFVELADIIADVVRAMFWPILFFVWLIKVARHGGKS